METGKYAFITVAVTAVFALLSACGSIETAYVETQSDSFSEEFKRDMKAAIVGRGSSAPFGLNWGDSVHTVKQKGVVLSECETGGNGLRWCEATNLKTPFDRYHIVTPYDNWEQNAWYYLVFEPTYSYGLQAVHLQIPFRTNRDRRGEKGRRTFEKVKEVMAEMYGDAYWEVSRNNSTLQLPYYECLDDEKCGKLVSEWKTAYGYADVRLRRASNTDNYDPFYKKFGELWVRWWTKRLYEKYN